MKSFYFISICLLSALYSFSQTSKIYINSNGVYVDNAKKAVSYALITKLSDTIYRVSTFYMNDTIISKGYYKDSSLTIPNGVFFYYTKKTIPEKLKGTLNTDTNNYLSTVGYFTDGRKTGNWVEYIKRGVKKCVYAYQNNQLNGLFKRFDFAVNNYIREEGYYVNNKREGEWNKYGYDTIESIVQTNVFKDDKLIKTIDHISAPVFAPNLQDFLSTRLHSKSYALLLQTVNTEITIDIDGRITDPVILTPMSRQIDASIIKALIDAPKFTPELRDGKPVKTRYFLSLLLKKNGTEVAGYNQFLLSLYRKLGNGLIFGATEL